MIKKKAFVIAILILLAVAGIIVFVTLFTQESNNNFDGVLVNGFDWKGKCL